MRQYQLYALSENVIEDAEHGKIPMDSLDFVICIMFLECITTFENREGR